MISPIGLKIKWEVTKIVIAKKIINTIKYRCHLLKNWYIRNIKYHNVKNKVLNDLVVRDYVYKKMKKKYASKIVKNDNKSSINTSNKVWICWFQGKENAPELIQKCIASAEKRLKNHEVIILTWDNYKDYCDIPDYIVKKVESKKISLVHFSDILRVSVLTKHGGLWLDSTVLCTTDGLPDYMHNVPLFVYKEINLNSKDTMPTAASSWLIYAGRNNNILMATRDMLYSYWKKESFLNDYFLFHIFFKIATEIYKEEWEEVPNYNNINPHMLQFELSKKFNKKRWEELISMSSFHKLNRHIDYSTDAFTNYDYILNDFKVKK